jgi:hypothetical protein
MCAWRLLRFPGCAKVGSGMVIPAPNKITALDAAMTLCFHVVAHSRGASELCRYAKSTS